MKYLKRVGVLVTMIAMIGVFAGCGKKTTIVGTWSGDDYTYIFNSDGTGTIVIVFWSGNAQTTYTSYCYLKF